MDTASWVNVLAQRENGNEKEGMTTSGENKETSAQGTSISKQQLEFSLLFEFTEDEKLIEDYACAYQKEKVFAHGRIYFSEHYVSFFSTLFANVKLKVPISSVLDIQKKNTAILFPNAIEITLKDQQKLFFSSFLYRDKAFQTLSNIVSSRGKLEGEAEVEESISIGENKGVKPPLNTSNSFAISPSVSINEATKKFSHKSFDESVLKKESTSPTSSTPINKERSSSGNAPGRNIAIDEISSDIESESSRKRRSLSFTIQQLQSGAPMELQDRSPSTRSATLSQLVNSNTPLPITKASAMESFSNSASDLSSPRPSNDSKCVTPNSSMNIPENIPCTHFTEFKEDFYINEQIADISMEKFYTLFLEGPEFWLQVNKEFNYNESTVTPWMQENQGKCCCVRNLSFIAPVTQRFGPKSTKVMQTHRVRVNANKQLVLETFSTSRDVPYGDSFNVVNRFVISNIQESQGGKTKAIQFQAATFIKFSKSVWGIQSMIEKSASASGREFSMKLVSLVKDKITKTPSKELESPSSQVSSSDIRTTLPTKSEEISAFESAPVSSPLLESSAVPRPTSHGNFPYSKATLIQEYGESNSFIKLTALLSFSSLVLLLLILLPFTYTIYSHVHKLEIQNINMHRSTEKLESKIEFMQTILEILIQNNSHVVDQDTAKYFGKDKSGVSLAELWKSWKMNGEVASKYDYWKKQLLDLQEEILLAKNFLDGSSPIIEPVSNQPIVTSVSIWGIIMYIFELIVLLLLLATAIVVLYLQFYQKKFKQD